MDRGWMELPLPEQPSDGLRAKLLERVFDQEELGEYLILYHRESVLVQEGVDELKEIMEPEDWARWERGRKRRWGARCTCSCCGTDFTAGWTGDGIALFVGDDGVPYDGWAPEGGAGVVTWEEGDAMSCPLCYAQGRLTRRGELRNGRVYRRLQAEVVNAGDYTAALIWMVERRQTSSGEDTLHFLPHQAIVIDRDGRLRRLVAELRAGGVQWKPRTRVLDPMQQPYRSFDAESFTGKMIGGWVREVVPELAGRTGEKTALEAYIQAGGRWPGSYLLLWRKHPQVENLLRQGFARAVAQELDWAIDQAGGRQYQDKPPAVSWVDWREKKPHRMLGMGRAAFRAIRGKNWSAEDARIWRLWLEAGQGGDALDYEDCRAKLGATDVRELLEMAQAGWRGCEPRRVIRYLEKRELLAEGAQHLIDYRRMLREGGFGETEETLWPRDLIAAHDRLAEQLAAMGDLACARRFAAARQRLEGLEWTDGRLCVKIPLSEEELKEEGQVLRHCVGGYGKSHCEGKPVFFIRRYRRPERSYYTLNIDMTRGKPERIQLHGYGNERHGDHKQYTHSIPREVLAFCDRWEREVLGPWWREQTEQERKKHDRAEVHGAGGGRRAGGSRIDGGRADGAAH